MVTFGVTPRVTPRVLHSSALEAGIVWQPIPESFRGNLTNMQKLTSCLPTRIATASS
jgi:hypothetical protein